MFGKLFTTIKKEFGLDKKHIITEPTNRLNNTSPSATLINTTDQTKPEDSSDYVSPAPDVSDVPKYISNPHFQLVNQSLINQVHAHQIDLNKIGVNP